MRPYTITHQNSVHFIRMLFILFSQMFTPQISAAQPIEVPLTVVTACQFIKTVDGSSGYGKNNDWKSIAKASVLLHAEKLGASHVVWDKFNQVGAFNGIATAKAYKCDS